MIASRGPVYEATSTVAAEVAGPSPCLSASSTNVRVSYDSSFQLFRLEIGSLHSDHRPVQVSSSAA